MTAQPDLQTYAAAAEAWLAGNATPRQEAAGPGPEKAWGAGSDDVSIFHDLTDDEERAVLDQAMAWQVRKYDAGYGAIDWPTDLPLGVYRLQVSDAATTEDVPLISAPERAFGGEFDRCWRASRR